MYYTNKEMILSEIKRFKAALIKSMKNAEETKFNSLNLVLLDYLEHSISKTNRYVRLINKRQVISSEEARRLVGSLIKLNIEKKSEQERLLYKRMLSFYENKFEKQAG